MVVQISECREPYLPDVFRVCVTGKDTHTAYVPINLFPEVHLQPPRWPSFTWQADKMQNELSHER